MRNDEATERAAIDSDHAGGYWIATLVERIPAAVRFGVLFAVSAAAIAAAPNRATVPDCNCPPNALCVYVFEDENCKPHYVQLDDFIEFARLYKRVRVMACPIGCDGGKLCYWTFSPVVPQCQLDPYAFASLVPRRGPEGRWETKCVTLADACAAWKPNPIDLDDPCCETLWSARSFCCYCDEPCEKP